MHLRTATPRQLDVDPAFAQHFQQLHQVFMYVTDRCNLACGQCIYKPSITHFIKEEIELTTALNLLCTFRNMGAKKVTLLGGEPTLYGHSQRSEPLFVLIEGIRSLGYEYVRLDTNGQRIGRLLQSPSFAKLDELAFSLDGFSAGTNDSLRGRGTFLRAVNSIRSAVHLGYKTTITCCIHRGLLERDVEGVLGIERMIRFAERLRVKQINFHDLFKVGVPMDTWTGDFAPQPQEWMGVYDELLAKIHEGQFRIEVRLPQCFVTETEFERRSKYFGYCPAKMGERVLVHPNGTLRICSNLICTGYGVGHFEERRIVWNQADSNELKRHDVARNTPCTNRARHKQYGKLVPLCFSFKPGQDEYVWRTQLEWDRKATNHLEELASGQ